MKIGLLTSSRADYGIYYPLCKALHDDPFFDLQILAFGTHLSKKFGYTINQIEKDNFHIGARFDTAPVNDLPIDITASMSKTMEVFNPHWSSTNYDLIFALGDRYEMFAAVSSALPYNISTAHLHGGETTLGAIDNSFRHAITAMSQLHFTSCSEYKQRVCDIIGSDEGVYNVGALSIDVLQNMRFQSKSEFYQQWGIDLNKPTILFTYHPETVGYEYNEKYIISIINAFEKLNSYQIVITMSNADTKGNVIRNSLTSFAKEAANVHLIESFGSQSYLSCMKHCTFMLGNTSSGFVEAYWFPKPVINLGERQRGRIVTPNIVNCSIDTQAILQAIKYVEGKKIQVDSGFYGDGNAAKKIVALLKEL